MPTTITNGRSAPAAATGLAGDDDPDQPPERLRRRSVAVCIDDETRQVSREDLDWLRDAALRALTEAAAPSDRGAHELRVRVVNDDAMSSLHGRHLGDPATTDVLTFDLRDDPGGEPLDTDVIICLDEARRRSAAHGHETRCELLLYILHGALHCLGYDDHDPADARAMHAREDEVLTRIGVGPVYDRARASQGGAGR